MLHRNKILIGQFYLCTTQLKRISDEYLKFVMTNKSAGTALRPQITIMML